MATIWYSQLVLPILIAFLTTMVGYIFKTMFDIYQRDKTLRTTELERSQKIHDEVILSMDKIYTLMKYNAWNISLRRATGDSAVTTDDADWKKYRDALEHWRTHDLIFRAQVSSYFEDNYQDSRSDLINFIENGMKKFKHKKENEVEVAQGKLSEVIRCVTDKLNKAADLLWLMYWKREFLPISQTSYGNFVGIEQELESGISKEEENARRFFAETLNTIDNSIQALSKMMTEDIQDEHVGKLRRK